MTKTTVTAPSVPATLAQQQAAFTAEGSPPPGKVLTAGAMAPPRDQPRLAAARHRPIRGTITLKRASASK